MTYQSALVTSESLTVAHLVASEQDNFKDVIVTSSNNTAVFRLTFPNNSAYTDITITFPDGFYSNALMAAISIDDTNLPLSFTSIDRRVAVAMKSGAWEGATLGWQGGTATWLGFTSGQSVVCGASKPSVITNLLNRIAALEDATASSGSAGGSMWTKSGSYCWHASPTGTIATGTLGYASGAGYAAVSPLYIKKELSFSKIMLEIGTVFTTGCTYSCIVLSDAGLDYDYPGTILIKADIATTTGSGAQIASITPITLPAGDYWIGAGISAVEGASGALVLNTGLGLVQPYAPTGSGRSGNARNPAGWLTNNYAVGAVGTNWPARTSSGMDTYYRVPRIGIWAG